MDNVVQCNLKIRDDRHQDGEGDSRAAGSVDTDGHLIVIRGSVTGQRTQPFLITEGPGAGYVGVGQLPAVIDQVVSQTEEDRTLPSGLDACLDFDGGDGVGGQGATLGLNCFLAEMVADGLKM